MSYASLQDCINDLEKNGMLRRVTEEVDPCLQMAAIHLRVHEAKGPALLFENVKGTKYRAASNLFGTLQRSEFIFRHTLKNVQQLIDLKNDPGIFLKHPFSNVKPALAAFMALPLKHPVHKPVLYEQITIAHLPLIKHWKNDGGAFITLPQVYTEDITKPGIMHANLGMYRIQLNGNEYELNKEVGLHYQIHRGIGVHQSKANAKGLPLKVSIFVGGPPAHTVAAVMPLPEGMSEMTFAGALGSRRFRYCYEDGYCISTDADFVITGMVYPHENKPEGPFGDHLGYYSLKHPFPLMKVHKVYARKNAIWPFTVVGRPPQEDTSFGQLIHHISGNALQKEIPGLREVHAVDAAGVHPLLLAIGSERYTPYNQTKQPSEILTIANRILGTGQLSLAKFLFITADDNQSLTCKDIPAFFRHFLERTDFRRDLHFYTNTSMDTLDYSGTGLHTGSKLVLASYGEKKRTLASVIPPALLNCHIIQHAKIVMPGVVAFQSGKFDSYEKTRMEMTELNDWFKSQSASDYSGIQLMVLTDCADFASATLNNFLWVTFTRSNPSHDVHGIESFSENKHWGCSGPLLIDARKKPHHAPELVKDAAVEKAIDKIFEKGGSLSGIL